MGLDRRGIQAIWFAAVTGPIGFALYREAREFPDLPWMPIGAGGSVVGLGISWLLLHRRYEALAGAEHARSMPVGPGRKALADRLMLAFFVHDPCGSVLDEGRGAYRDEAAALAEELPGIRNEAHLRTRIRELLLASFSEPPDPGDRSLHELATEIWTFWIAWPHRQRLPR